MNHCPDDSTYIPSRAWILTTGTQRPRLSTVALMDERRKDRHCAPDSDLGKSIHRRSHRGLNSQPTGTNEAGHSHTLHSRRRSLTPRAALADLWLGFRVR